MGPKLITAVRNWRGLRFVAWLCFVEWLGVAAHAQSSPQPLPEPIENATASAPESARPRGASRLQKEYEKLAQQLHGTDIFARQEAAQSLLRVRPSDVADPEVRKLIARGYRGLVEGDRGGASEAAIRGLALWGGKYSVPLLVEMIEGDRLGKSDEAFAALGRLKDPRGAEAVVKHLGNFFTHQNAMSALRKMGPVAEDALIAVGPTPNPEVAMAVITLLADVGTEKSLPLLRQGVAARNPQVKQAARAAIQRIIDRKKKGPGSELPSPDDAQSPLAQSAGPPVDLRPGDERDLPSPRAPERRAAPKPPGFVSGGLFAGNDNASQTQLDPAQEDEEGDEESTNANELGDWSEVRRLLPSDPVGTGVAPESLETPSDDWKPQPIRLAGGSDLQTPAPLMSLSLSQADAPLGLVLYRDPFPNATFAQLELLDLRKRQSKGIANVPAADAVLISPSGARFVLIKSDLHGKEARLDLWAIVNGKPQELNSWAPYANSPQMLANELTWAAWVNDQQLFTMNGHGELVLWGLSNNRPKAIYQLDGSMQSTPALSTGRTYLGMTTPRGAEIFRVNDGELLARMQDVRPSGGIAAFTADATRLAVVAGTSIYVWDTTQGKLLRDFDCSQLKSGRVAWLDKKHLLVGGTDVVDVNCRLILWRYEMEGLNAFEMMGPWLWPTLQSGSLRGLVPTQLLQDKVLQAAQGIDPRQILALQPGAQVALELQLSGEDQTKAETALRRALTANGMEVVSDSPLRLVAKIVTGESRTTQYGRGFFHREEVEEVVATETHYEVELLLNGESAWKQVARLQSAHTPHTLWLKGDETAQQALDRENAERAERFNFSVAIPRYVVQPEYAGPRGTSSVTLAGAQ